MRQHRRLGATVFVLAMMAMSACASSANSSDDRTPDSTPVGSTTLKPLDDDLARALAFDYCKDFVKQRLKAPSTAKFRNFYQHDGEVVVTGSGNGPFTVQSTVDSQNSFGAMLRSLFSCTVTRTGKDEWHLDDIAIQ